MTPSTITARAVEFDVNKGKILQDLIFRQAGTIEKAILEGIMNAADAKATRIDIAVTPEEIHIADNGRGFKSAAEIETWFKVFGLEHEKAEDKRFARFRIGRGQLFAFGLNEWRTGTFQMKVNAKELNEAGNIQFVLEEGHEEAVGCDITVSLYEPLIPSQVLDLRREVKKLAAWLDIPVYLEGEQISKDPSSTKWDAEDDDAYYRFTGSGSLDIYNDGVYVQSIPSYRYGLGGTVVSKSPLGVNFARNEVLSHDPMWQRMMRLIRKHGNAAIEKKKSSRMTDGERESLIRQIVSGERTGRDARKAKVVQDVTGRYWTFDDFFRKLRNYPAVTSAPEGDFRGDTLMQRDRAFVVATETLSSFGTSTLEDFFTLLCERKIIDSYDKWTIGDYESLVAGVSNVHRIIDEKDLTPKEVLLLDFVRYIYNKRFEWGETPRTLLAGDSETALAWTDGSTYIAIERNKLLRDAIDPAGWARLAEVLAHELCHEDPTTDQHIHTPEFYRAYHDMTLVSGFTQKFVKDAVAHFHSFLKRRGQTLTRKEAKAFDRLQLAERRMEDILGRPEKVAALEEKVKKTEKKVRKLKKLSPEHIEKLRKDSPVHANGTSKKTPRGSRKRSPQKDLFS